jgi:hypothetical protein
MSTMFNESNLITKLFITLVIACYVIVASVIYFPVIMYKLLVDMVDYVWHAESKPTVFTKS